jgi:hypothetical protein
LDLGERLVKLECGKYFISSFIGFQYGELSKECKAHNPIFQSLEKHGIERVCIPFGYPLSTSKDQGEGTSTGKARGTREEFIEYAKEHLRS